MCHGHWGSNPSTLLKNTPWNLKLTWHGHLPGTSPSPKKGKDSKFQASNTLFSGAAASYACFSVGKFSHPEHLSPNQGEPWQWTGSTHESSFCISGTTPSPQTSGYDLSRFPSSTTVVTSQGNLKIQLLKVFSTNEVYSTCDFSANIQISSSRKTGFLHKKQLYKLYKD